MSFLNQNGLSFSNASLNRTTSFNDTGLLAYYTFEETSGVLANHSLSVDTLGAAADCTNISTPDKTNTGKIGNSWSGDGSSTAAQMGNALSFVGTSDFSINLWVKTTSTARSNLWGVFHSDTNDIQLEMRASPCYLRFNMASAIDSTTVINTGSWVMITCTRIYGGTNETCEVSINGVNNVLINSEPHINVNTTYKANIFGRNNNGSNDLWLNGELDEMSIWNRVLTDAEITALYNSGLGLSIYD